MKKHFFSFLLPLFILLFPLAIFAQEVTNVVTLSGRILSIVNTFTTVLMAVAGFVFMFGIFSYFIAGDEEKKGKGKNVAIYGLLGLLLMIGVWALLRIITNSLGVSTGSGGGGIVITEQICGEIDTVGAFFDALGCYIGVIIVPLIVAISGFVFIFGIFKFFVASPGNEEARVKGRFLATVGLIVFAIGLSLWAFVRIITGSLGFNIDFIIPNLPEEYNGLPEEGIV